MRLAESLNNTKKRMMDAVDRGDRATVAEITDYLAYKVMDAMAHTKIVTEAYEKKSGLTKAEMAIDLFKLFGGLAKFGERMEEEHLIEVYKEALGMN